MSPQQLGEEIERFIADCVQRVAGIGRDQYYNAETNTQRFETMPLDDLFEYYEEELRDIVNYATMAHIRLKRLREALASRNLEWVKG
jgi:hypothetical protein